MPVHVSIATALDKGKLASEVVYSMLLEIDVLDRQSFSVTETLRFAHNNEDIVFQGNTYTAMPFTFNVARAKNELPSVSLTVEDPTQTIQAQLQESQGGVDFPVRLYVVTSVNPDTPEVEEHFKVVAAKSSSGTYAVELELGAENPLALRFPVNYQFRNRCRHLYRGSLCKYAGGIATCDMTLDGPNGCKAHSNQRNFGGFPGIRRNGYGG